MDKPKKYWSCEYCSTRFNEKTEAITHETECKRKHDRKDVFIVVIIFLIALFIICLVYISFNEEPQSYSQNEVQSTNLNSENCPNLNSIIPIKLEASGNYIVTLKSNEGIETEKFVKIKK